MGEGEVSTRTEVSRGGGGGGGVSTRTEVSHGGGQY